MIEHSRPDLGAEERQAILDAMEEGWIGEGPRAERLVQALSEMTGAKGGISVGSATDGLFACLIALGIGPGDEVLIPSLACRDVLDAVWRSGAKPRLCDARSLDFNMDLSALAEDRPAAAIVAHLFGFPCATDRLDEAGIPIIEDCAHAAGAELRGKPVGSFGAFSVFSLSAIKSLPGGEGGVAVARTEEGMTRLKRLKEGRDEAPLAARYRSRTTDLTAAASLVQLRRLPETLQRRSALARRFARGLSHLPVSFLQPEAEATPSWHRFIVTLESPCPDRPLKDLLSAFWDEGVRTRLPVTPGPLHQRLGLSPLNFPVAEDLSSRSISLPFYPNLTEEEILHILATCERLL